jgi:hypothetical protein
MAATPRPRQRARRCGWLMGSTSVRNHTSKWCAPLVRAMPRKSPGPADPGNPPGPFRSADPFAGEPGRAQAGQGRSRRTPAAPQRQRGGKICCSRRTAPKGSAPNSISHLAPGGREGTPLPPLNPACRPFRMPGAGWDHCLLNAPANRRHPENRALPPAGEMRGTAEDMRAAQDRPPCLRLYRLDSAGTGWNRS